MNSTVLRITALAILCGLTATWLTGCARPRRRPVAVAPPPAPMVMTGKTMVKVAEVKPAPVPKPGMQDITISVSRATTPVQNIRANSKVNVVSTVRRPDGQKEEKTILQDVTVSAVESTGEGTERKGPVSVTLSLTKDQAETLILAGGSGELSLVPRPS